MAYNNFYSPYQGYNPYQQYQPSFQQQIQNQPNFQQSQQPIQQQIQNGGFVSVHNENEARNYPIAPGNSVTFKDENAPYDGYSRDGDMHDGYSGRGRMYYDGYSGRYSRDGRGRGSNAKRDSMGRYSSRGYSYAEAKEDMVAELKELAKKAPDEKTKQEIEHFANEMESK